MASWSRYLMITLYSFIRRNYLKFIIIELHPVTVRILQVDLLHLVGPQLWGLVILRPISILDIQGIEMLREFVHRRNTKRQVNIDIMRNILLRARDHMQLPVLRDAEPHMLAIMERLGYPFEFQHLFIKISRPVQVRHKDRLMTELRTLRICAASYTYRPHR